MKARVSAAILAMLVHKRGKIIFGGEGHAAFYLRKNQKRENVPYN